MTGNALPAFLSWVLLVGWETVLVSLSSLGTATVFAELGWGGGDATKVVGFLVTAALVVAAGVLGFDVIMRLQTWITIATIVLTIGFIALTLDEVDWDAVSGAPSGSTQAFIGALALVATGFGVGWANTAADYSRYLPRSASGRGRLRLDDVRRRGRARWSCTVFGILLALVQQRPVRRDRRRPDRGADHAAPDLVPRAVRRRRGARPGRRRGARHLLVRPGPADPRRQGPPAGRRRDRRRASWSSARSTWSFFADDFIGPFQGFLITVGVPIAAWAGVFVADLLLRHQPYADAELYDPRGRYGAVHWPGVLLVVVGTVLGWGLVTNTARRLADLAGLPARAVRPRVEGHGAWAYANLGVFVAFAVGFVGWLLLGRSVVAGRNGPAPGTRRSTQPAERGPSRRRRLSTGALPR